MKNKMNFDIVFKNYDLINDTDINEILRYMGCNAAKCGEEFFSLANKAKTELSEKIRPKAVWRYAKINSIDCDTVDFGFLKLKSKALCKNLEDCRYAAFMVATLGSETDIIIKKYSVSSMTDAVAINAAGSAFIESYCDYINSIIADEAKKEGYGVSSRFSPGYGELDLECQKKIFSYLDAQKHTGVYLTESFMMMPSKSVCAIVGIGNTNKMCMNKCSLCDKSECEFRKGI